MTSRFQKLLAMPVLHYIGTRFGAKAVKKKCFDEKYRNGEWKFENNCEPELVSVIEKYSRGGGILMLGCGPASVARILVPKVCSSFLGVDISLEAITRAQLQQAENIRFELGDFVKAEYSGRYDIILFSESLYYVNPLARRALLARLAGNLNEKGWIIVTIAQPLRYHGIIDMIRRHFNVVEDRRFDNSSRHLVVFR
jgi:trans-aconitate methyltransferase